ncbi:hypothetical protein AB4516_21475 [Vibrio sp. 10N.222.54.F12]|uniref:hypothetical protein n=1 Tax=Vibrio TaxID=662 RepID=UPI000C81BE37|nr:hypothetical protein [Vibrio tasmaniensis]PML12493.1 hypothetical protein BCT83_20795 [Vibrio tasmaniensis]
MIKFNIDEALELAFIHYRKNENLKLYISEKTPVDLNYIQAPRLICHMVALTLINNLRIEDFDFGNQTFSFLPEDTERVEELFEIFKSLFDSNSQYLVILYEDQNGHPQYRFELNTARKLEIIEECKKKFEQLDLLQVANGVIIDALSIRIFGGHVELIDRLSPQIVPQV